MRRARAPRVAVGPACEDRLRFRRRRRGPVRGASARGALAAPRARGNATGRCPARRVSSSTGGVPGASIRVSRPGRVSRRGGRCTGRCAQAAGRSAPGEWLTFEAPGTDRRKGRLGLDPCGAWTTLELGWSANEHYSVHMCCRPWVELLASVGLEAFALRGSRDGYRYHLWRAAALPGAVAAFGGRGRCVHSLAGYRVTTGRNGPNTVFRRASPLAEARP